jgi:hypothetical protein
MRHRLTWLVLFIAAIMVAASFYSGHVWATAPHGFAATTLAMGTLGPFEIERALILSFDTEVLDPAF